MAHDLTIPQLVTLPLLYLLYHLIILVLDLLTLERKLPVPSEPLLRCPVQEEVAGVDVCEVDQDQHAEDDESKINEDYQFPEVGMCVVQNLDRGLPLSDE